MSQEKQLFQLTGFQRSGTTLLAYLLNAHPDILCADEPELTKRVIYDQKYMLSDLNNDALKKNLDYYKVDKTKYLQLVDNYLSGHLNDRTFIIQCYELMNKKNASLIGSKEVCDIVSFKFDFLNLLLKLNPPDTKYIIIERNFNDIAESFKKIGFFPPGKRKINFINSKIFLF